MVILDTSVILDKIKEKSNIQENITVVNVIECPFILKYAKFRGKVYYPKLDDFKVAYKIQENFGKKVR